MTRGCPVRRRRRLASGLWPLGRLACRGAVRGVLAIAAGWPRVRLPQRVPGLPGLLSRQSFRPTGYRQVGLPCV